ncbi:hypothetical protein Hanom_Chr07g00631651 [Helianthus anomalus]
MKPTAGPPVLFLSFSPFVLASRFQPPHHYTPTVLRLRVVFRKGGGGVAVSSENVTAAAAVARRSLAGSFHRCKVNERESEREL